MDLPFTLEGFANKRLMVRLGSIFKGPLLVVDGVELDAKAQRKGLVLDDAGLGRRLMLKPVVWDAIPKIQVDDQKSQRIAPPLAWYEYVWVGLPFCLIPAGGAIGGLFGAIAMMTNARIFRTKETALSRYGLTALVTLAATSMVLAAATAIQMLAHRNG